MKNKFKRFLCLVLVAACCFTINAPTAMAQTKSGVTTSAVQRISTYKNRTGYRYTIKNGHLWRRLYDYTLEEWIGDWELVD